MSTGPATGTPIIIGNAIEGQTLTVDVSSVSDPDGIQFMGALWQRSTDGGVTFTDAIPFFSPDGTSDVVWYNPTTNNVEIWLLQNGQWAGSVDIGTHPAGSVAVGVGDFDHNGVSDIMWRDTTTNHIENWMLAYS